MGVFSSRSALSACAKLAASAERTREEGQPSLTRRGRIDEAVDCSGGVARDRRRNFLFRRKKTTRLMDRPQRGENTVMQFCSNGLCGLTVCGLTVV